MKDNAVSSSGKTKRRTSFLNLVLLVLFGAVLGFVNWCVDRDLIGAVKTAILMPCFIAVFFVVMDSVIYICQ